MAKTEMIRARVEPDLKVQAERVLRELGLSPRGRSPWSHKPSSPAQGVPFEVSIPNAEHRGTHEAAKPDN